MAVADMDLWAGLWIQFFFGGLWIQLDSTRSKVRTARTYPPRYHKLDHFLIFSRGSIPTKIKPIFLSPARLSFFPACMSIYLKIFPFGFERIRHNESLTVKH
jgi:hypothetical protein